MSLLFNIVTDMLITLIKRAKEDGQISGVVPHLVDGGLSILQYVDDTTHLKLLLYAFEQASGYKINFHKSEICYFGEAEEDKYIVALGRNLRTLVVARTILAKREREGVAKG